MNTLTCAVVEAERNLHEALQLVAAAREQHRELRLVEVALSGTPLFRYCDLKDYVVLGTLSYSPKVCMRINAFTMFVLC